MPCPYLPGRVERRIVTELMGRQASTFHDNLTLAGYRRSHSIAYAPACPTCQACIAVRIVVDQFKPSRSQRRIININEDLFAAYRLPKRLMINTIYLTVTKKRGMAPVIWPR